MIEQIDLLLGDSLEEKEIKEWTGILYELSISQNRKDYVGKDFLILSGKYEGFTLKLLRFNGTNVIFSKGEEKVHISKCVKVRYFPNQ